MLTEIFEFLKIQIIEYLKIVQIFENLKPNFRANFRKFAFENLNSQKIENLPNFRKFA